MVSRTVLASQAAKIKALEFDVERSTQRLEAMQHNGSVFCAELQGELDALRAQLLAAGGAQGMTDMQCANFAGRVLSVQVELERRVGVFSA